MRKFLKDTKGNVGIVLALSALPLFAAAGAAVDYTGRIQAEARLQAAIDAGALAGAVTEKESETEIRKAVRRYAKANGSNEYLGRSSSIKVTIKRDGTIHVSAKGKYKTGILGVVGIKELPLIAEAQTKRNNSGAEIALVLDVTGSMSGGKIDALKTAAREFVAETTKKNDNKPDTVRISVVPYNKYVNVGMHNRNAPWIDVPADSSTTNNVCQDWTTNTNERNCRNETYTYTSDGVQKTGTRRVCDYDTVTVNECRPVTTNVTWTGCVGSRDHPWNVRDGRPNLRIPGLMNTWCSTELLPLTSDRNSLNSHIDSLYAAGDTYIPGGLIWGWRTLSSEVPFTEGVSNAQAQLDGVTKHIVLMTDGENVTSKSSGSAFHDGWKPDEGDDTTSELCTNVKSDKIVVHAIAFGVTDPATKRLLENCASTPENYYDAGDNAQLVRAFEAIAGQINRVHLSK